MSCPEKIKGKRNHLKSANLPQKLNWKSVPDALMSAFAMFSLKDPSLLKFDERRKKEAECQNLKGIYDIENITSDSGMREIGDEIDPKKYISPIFKILLRKGFTLNDKRLKTGKSMNYFKELQERIREIRLSERFFYQKIKDIYHKY